MTNQIQQICDDEINENKNLNPSIVQSKNFNYKSQNESEDNNNINSFNSNPRSFKTGISDNSNRPMSIKYNSKETTNNYQNLVKKNENITEMIKKKNSDPSDVFASGKNLVSDIEQKLAELSSQKKQIENEIFKLPEKQKTAIQISRRKMLEEQLATVDKEINLLRVKLREGNKR